MKIITEAEKIRDEISGMENWTRFTAVGINEKKFRATRDSADSVFVYAPKKKSQGWRYSIENFAETYYGIEVEEDSDEEKKWHRRLDRAVKCLDASGLWPELRETFLNLRGMSLSDKQELDYAQANAFPWKDGKRDIDYAAIAPLMLRFPFAFCKGEDGEPYIRTDYIGETADCKLKSMYFGRGTELTKERIRDHIERECKWSERERASYDVSYDYDPDLKKAWYSEEYRDCGNGHYYIALDHSTALFVEND